MTTSRIRFARLQAIRWAALCLLQACAPAWSGNLVVSPAMGGEGSQVSLSASGLTPFANYTLEFAGQGITSMGSYAADRLGQIKQPVNINGLPTGPGKLRLKTSGTGGGSVVAYTVFSSLPTLTFSIDSRKVHAGQSLPFQVSGLTTGSLTIEYEGIDALGPIAVGKQFSGKLVIPSDRPSPLPAIAQLSLINRVGKTVVNRLDTTLAVSGKLSKPFLLPITTPQSPQTKSSQPLSLKGKIDLGDNESAPEQVSMWYFGDDGSVFPLASAQPSSISGDLVYELAGTSPGMMAMTAGQTSAGRVSVVGSSNNTLGIRAQVEQVPSNPRLDSLPDDIWRIRVRVVKANGTPIPGAIVQFDGADVTELDNPLQFHMVGSLGEYLTDNIAPSQLMTFRASDDRGCPLTLNRKITDAQGYAEFLFTDEELWLASMPVPVGFEHGNQPVFASRPLRLAVNASGQGYGFQFPDGPYAGLFLPHIYRVIFDGVGDGDPNGDSITFIDDYQDVTLASGSRSFTYTQALPPITPMVVLYDTAILPLVSHRVRTIGSDGGGSYLRFGPVYSEKNVPPGWIGYPPNHQFPTAVSVRTDPVVGGVVTSAKLYLDANQNGTPEFISNFVSATTPLDCSIDGIAQTKTWSATLPNLRQRPTERLKGYLEFQAANGTVREDIAIDVKTVDSQWMAGPRYSGRQIVYSEGGQRVLIRAVENSGDAQVQLDRDPGYDIGRLKNQTTNTRAIEMVMDRHGVSTVDAPLDGEHKEAGRSGAPTLIEPVTGVAFHEEETLLDQSFPLFYYVWGVPILAGIELGANFSVLAEIVMEGKSYLKANAQPALQLTTTPSLDLGLNFYIDIDVLFDLVDGGVDLDAIFGLDMPIDVKPDRNPEVIIDECFSASLILSWHFEVFCLPLDFICDSFNDIEGSEVLLADQIGSGCGNPLAPTGLVPGLAGAGGKSLLPTAKSTRPSARIQPRQTALSYSPSGAGFMALTRDLSSGAEPPVLVVRPVDGSDFSRDEDEVILSTAPGIRSVDVAFYQDDRAVIVWAENADNYETLRTRTPLQRIARQRLMFSRWDGSVWSAKQPLTPVSGGEGGVDLAACRVDDDPNCPADGEVLAVWTRDMTGNLLDHQTQVFHSRFTAAGGWTVPASIDSNALLDSAPAAGYANGQPVVALVRSQSGVFSDTNARRIAYRLLGVAGSTVQVPAASPIAAAWPSIAGHPDGSFEIIHTHADDPAMFVGNTQRVAMLAMHSCGAGICAADALPLADSHGRAVYGERPQTMVDGDGNVTVVMRGMGFGNDASGSNHSAQDPIGMVTHTGEVISFAVGTSSPVITPKALSADGAGHLAPTATFDPHLKQVVVASSRGLSLPTQLVNRYKASGKKLSRAVSKARTADPGLDVFTTEQGSDFSIESVVASTSSLTGGSSISVDVTVRNIGAAYTTTTANRYQVRLSWDAPHDAGGTPVGARFMPSLQSGEAKVLHYTTTLPADFSPDQFHRLYARSVRSGLLTVDSNGDNDQAQQDFGGMPRVFGLNASPVPGSTLVQLSWDAPNDPESLIAGYRVWHHDGDGQWQHLGSSFVTGFLDLTAPPNVTRHYRITSYSRNTIESDPGNEAIAKAVLATTVFGSGFE